MLVERSVDDQNWESYTPFVRRVEFGLKLCVSVSLSISEAYLGLVYVVLILQSYFVNFAELFCVIRICRRKCRNLLTTNLCFIYVHVLNAFNRVRNV